MVINIIMKNIKNVKLFINQDFFVNYVELITILGITKKSMRFQMESLVDGIVKERFISFVIVMEPKQLAIFNIS